MLSRWCWWHASNMIANYNNINGNGINNNDCNVINELVWIQWQIQ